MDSKLLAGAYSKRYRYIEREHIEKLKNDSVPEKLDVLARARRLSQETNRRRRLQAQKRKTDAAREEKRRQEILNRRHHEQQQATEKYQRYHVGSKSHICISSHRQMHGSVRQNEIDEVLRLVTGVSPNTIYRDDDSAGMPLIYHQQQNCQDPLQRSYIKNSHGDRASSPQHDSHHKGIARPASGVQRTLDASMRAEMIEHSMRNLTSSRSRFEHQLEQHQQFLLQQQQKSLQEFNQAIRQEIDNDPTLQGMEDASENSLENESLSSLDSLEGPLQSSSVSETRFQQACTDSDPGRLRDHVPGQPAIDRNKVKDQLAQEQMERKQQDLKKVLTSSSRSGEAVLSTIANNHAVESVSQGFKSAVENQYSSATVLQSGYHHCPTEIPVSAIVTSIASGTSTCLPQQAIASPANQVIKQPAPAMQYSSQLLAHRRFDSSGNVGGGDVPPGAGRKNYCSGKVDDLHMPAPKSMPSGNTHTDSAVLATCANDQDDNFAQVDRPKAHVYAWISPLPSQQNEIQAPFSSAISASTVLPTVSPPLFASNMAEDRVMATNISPHSARSTATAVTTTWIYTSVSTNHNKEPLYSQAALNLSTVTTHQSSFGGITVDSVIPRNQENNSGPPVTPVVSHSGSAISKPSSALAFQCVSETSKAINVSNIGKENQAPVSNLEGSIAKGTLGPKNGQQAVFKDTMSGDRPLEYKVVFEEDNTNANQKEVRSILKRPSQEVEWKNKSSLAMRQTKFDVQDSIEMTRKHLINNKDSEQRKMKKKAVRFADLQYAEECVDEDDDSEDSLTEATEITSVKKQSQDDIIIRPVAAPEVRHAHVRPASAKVGSGEMNNSRAPRAASAGPSRTPVAVRPKAAAHIIMSSEAAGHMVDGSTTGITVHKSQLEKKVTLVNNNFMSCIPTYTALKASDKISAGTTTSGNSPAPLVYTIAQGRNISGISTFAMEGDSTQKAGLGKTISANGTAQNPPGNASRTPVSNAANTSILLPSHSHFRNSNSNSSKTLYSETGLRIDRTPTDDEINSLWMNMRTILDKGDKGQVPAAPLPTNTVTSGGNNNSSDHRVENRPTVQLSNKYIDGTFLAHTGGMRPAYSTHSYAKTPTGTNSTGNMLTNQVKGDSQNKNGYAQHYSLLQQRRNASTTGPGTRSNGVADQTLRPLPVSSKSLDPRQMTSMANAAGYQVQEEVSESMAGFLAAEEMLHAHGSGVSDSRVMAAIDSAQTQQEIYNNLRHKISKGGPSALSIEEHRLVESLDRLNDRLRVIENREPGNQQACGVFPGSQRVYVHSAGFRGHQLTSQRGGFSNQRMAGRPFSSRLLNRQHY